MKAMVEGDEAREEFDLSAPPIGGLRRTGVGFAT